MSKPAVTSLQEFCAKQKIAAPVYTCVSCEERGFQCDVKVMNIEDYGESKRDAKYMAAQNAAKRLGLMHSNIMDLPDTDENGNPAPARDMIEVLRDYCVFNEHPLPAFEIVAQCSTGDAPEFVAQCKVASIVSYGSSDNKEDAKQKAAAKVHQIMITCEQDENFGQETSVFEDKLFEVESQRREVFKTYREFKEQGKLNDPSVPLSERHNYFIKFHEPLKAAGRAIIAKDYESKEQQAKDLLKALKITPTYGTMEGEKGLTLVTVEFDCRFDVFLVGEQDKIHNQIVSYLKDMLREPSNHGEGNCE